MPTVTIDGLTFHGGSDADSGYVYSDLQGWYSGAPVRAPLEDRPNADGAFGLEVVYRSARPLRFTGALLGDDAQSAQAELWEAFAAIQSDGRPIEITVVDVTGTKSVTCTLSGTPTVSKLNDWSAEVEASFLCFDPVKYGPARFAVTGLPVEGGGLEYPLHDPAGALFYGANGELGRVELVNNGTARTFPVVTVTGGMADGFFIQRLDTGDVVRYDRVVPLGTDVRVDMRTGAVVVDGTSDGSSSLSRSDFFGVEPGASFSVQFNALGAVTGTPTMTVETRDGFW